MTLRSFLFDKQGQQFDAKKQDKEEDNYLLGQHQRNGGNLIKRKIVNRIEWGKVRTSADGKITEEKKQKLSSWVVCEVK